MLELEVFICIVIFAVCYQFSDYVLWGVAKLLHWPDRWIDGGGGRE
jgi:hypothetical protein